MIKQYGNLTKFEFRNGWIVRVFPATEPKHSMTAIAETTVRAEKDGNYQELREYGVDGDALVNFLFVIKNKGH